MENSELETTILKPSQNPPFLFPPRHRHRRPIQSETYLTLVRILSHCDALQSFPQPIQDDNATDKLGSVAKNNALVDENHMELKSSLIQPKSPISGAKEARSFQDEGNDTLNEVHKIDPMHVMKQGDDVLLQDNNVNLIRSFVEKDQTFNIVTQKIAVEKQICSVMDFHKEFSPSREQKVFDDTFINEVPEAVSSSVNMDLIADISRPTESNNEKSPVIEGHLSDGIEHQLQLKQKEFEGLISASGNLDLSQCDIADLEIEEGEISGEMGVSDEAMDLLFEDAVSLEEKKLDKIPVSEHTAREVFPQDGGDGRLRNWDGRSSLFSETVDGSNDIMEMERKSSREEKDTRAEVFAHGEDMATKIRDNYDTLLETGRSREQAGGVKETDHPSVPLEDKAQHGEIICEDITENKDPKTAGVEDSAGKKKKKKGPLTKERRAKKKQKERIKRAEKNRKLGVKRLKLQPMLKPKTVSYCRHYLKGRCQEGEKCKFSHDTTPLTKSKPCCYFARHSCMKGDNCPFDHQLSKYPCDNVVSKGFCCRGVNCLFSHEISGKDASLAASNVSKPEFTPPFLTRESNSKKKVNDQCMSYQQLDPKFSTMENSSGKITQNKVSDHLERPAAHIPKGICLISHVRSPPGYTSQREQTASCLKGDSEKVNRSMISSLPDSIQNSNEIGKGVTSRTPKGINFLSFGKRSLDDSDNRSYGVGESFLDQSNKHKLVGSSSKSDDGVKVDNHTGQSSMESKSNMNKVANIVSPTSTPQGMKFLSFGKAPVDNSSAVKQVDLLPNNVNMGPPRIPEKENALDGHKFSSAIPQTFTSSPNPFCRSMDQSGAGNCGAMSSSSKTSFLMNTSTSVQKALQSTLAFAAKFESEIKFDRSLGTRSDMKKHENSVFRGYVS